MTSWSGCGSWVRVVTCCWTYSIIAQAHNCLVVPCPLRNRFVSARRLLSAMRQQMASSLSVHAGIVNRGELIRLRAENTSQWCWQVSLSGTLAGPCTRERISGNISTRAARLRVPSCDAGGKSRLQFCFSSPPLPLRPVRRLSTACSVGLMPRDSSSGL
jgi:hypothetical protein